LVNQLHNAHPSIEADIARRLLIACEDSEERVKTIAIEYEVLFQIKKYYLVPIDYGLERNYP
jgi:Zn-dependent peptidase ImmA (M78 family)